MTFFLRDKVYIPTEWTPEQAMAVWELLDEISSAIWDVHEKGILKAFNTNESLLERADPSDDSDDDSDDDYPF
jgi:hypothetical protein